MPFLFASRRHQRRKKDDYDGAAGGSRTGEPRLGGGPKANKVTARGREEGWRDPPSLFLVSCPRLILPVSGGWWDFCPQRGEAGDERGEGDNVLGEGREDG